MKLKNKYYSYFQYFCKDIGISENALRENIQKMKPKDRLVFKEFTLLLESIGQFQNEKTYVLKLFNKNKKCIRNGPTIITKPKKQRRAMSPFIATIILIAISIAGAGVILPSLTDIGNSAGQNTSCYLVNIKLYEISTPSQAYFITQLQNSGSIMITDANITFKDDLDAEFGFYESAISLLPGTDLLKNQTFAGSITRASPYLVDAWVTYEDGSQANCVQKIIAS